MIGTKALKAGMASALSMQALEDLVGDDPRFASVWSVTGSIPGSFGELNAAAIFTVLRQLRPRRIVEIGSYLGRSTVFFGKALQALEVDQSEVVAVDPHTGDRQQLEALGAQTLPSLGLFRTHVEACGLGAVVRPIVKRSAEAALGWDERIDLLYVDGWHSYEAVVQDGRDWLPHLSPCGVVFFDDYTRYAEVNRAVSDLAHAGDFMLWGNSFGQAVGGRDEPRPAAAPLLKVAGGPLLRRLHRLRE